MLIVRWSNKIIHSVIIIIIMSVDITIFMEGSFIHKQNKFVKLNDEYFRISTYLKKEICFLNSFQVLNIVAHDKNGICVN